MTYCKHCGEEIIKVKDRWYHTRTSYWVCDTAHAEPKEEDN